MAKRSASTAPSGWRRADCRWRPAARRLAGTIRRTGVPRVPPGGLTASQLANDGIDGLEIASRRQAEVRRRPLLPSPLRLRQRAKSEDINNRDQAQQAVPATKPHPVKDADERFEEDVDEREIGYYGQPVPD